ncbi:MAG: hypothetical protein Q9206_000761 [Seirophora lacunosa]
MELAGKVVDAAAWDTPTFNLYFPPEARDSVASFFQKLHAGNPRGAEVMRQVVFDNNDVPDGLDPGHRPLCLANNFAAYTQNTKPQPKMHVCPYMWKIPRLRDVAESVCKGSQMSKGTPNGSGKHVGDFTYGPLNVRNLRKNHPEDALYNADSYMWFALVGSHNST